MGKKAMDAIKKKVGGGCKEAIKKKVGGGCKAAIKKKVGGGCKAATTGNVSEKQREPKENTDKSKILFNRCSPEHVVNLIKKLHPCQKEDVEAMGLGGLLHMKVTFVKRVLCTWLVDHYDERTRCFQIHNAQMKITAAHVERILGVSGRGRVVYPGGRSNLLELKRLCFGERKGAGIDLRVLEKDLTTMTTGGPVFRMKFGLFVLGYLLCPTANCVVNLEYLHILHQCTSGSVDWASIILQFLLKGIAKYKAGQDSMPGCILFLMLFYFHYVTPSNECEEDEFSCSDPVIADWEDSKVKARYRWWKGIRSKEIDDEGFPKGVSIDMVGLEADSKRRGGEEYLALERHNMQLKAEVIECKVAIKNLEGNMDKQTTLLQRLYNLVKEEKGARADFEDEKLETENDKNEAKTDSDVVEKESERRNLGENMVVDHDLMETEVPRKGRVDRDSQLGAAEKGESVFENMEIGKEADAEKSGADGDLMEIEVPREGLVDRDSESGDAEKGAPVFENPLPRDLADISVYQRRKLRSDTIKIGGLQKVVIEKSLKKIVPKSVATKKGVKVTFEEEPTVSQATKGELECAQAEAPLKRKGANTKGKAGKVAKVAQRTPEEIVYQYLLDKDRSDDERLVQIGVYHIDSKSLRSLAPEGHVDSTVMSQLVHLLFATDLKSNHAMTRFYVPPVATKKFLEEGENVDSFYKSVFSKHDYVGASSTIQEIFIPILSSKHWYLAVANVEDKIIYIVDSLKSSRRSQEPKNQVSKMRKCLMECFVKREKDAKICYVLNESNIKTVEKATTQDNDFDCGVFVAIHMMKATPRHPFAIEKNIDHRKEIIRRLFNNENNEVRDAIYKKNNLV